MNSWLDCLLISISFYPAEALVLCRTAVFKLWFNWKHDGGAFHYSCLARTFVGSRIFTSHFSWKSSVIPKTGLRGAMESCAGVNSTGSRSCLSKGFVLSCVCWGSASISCSTVQCCLKSLHCLPLQDIGLTLLFFQRSSLACVQSRARGSLPFLSYVDRLLPVPFSYFGGSCRDSNQGAADMLEVHCCNIFVSIPEANNRK